MRVLISAFSCSPGRSSEPGIGWGVVCEAARRHEVCVLVDPHNQQAIARELAERPVKSVEFVFVEVPLGYERVARFRGLSYAYYVAWQLRAFQVAAKLHRMCAFDLVHHATFGNSWAPSFMGWLGIPFIWCAGGNETTPWRFFGVMSWRARIVEALRSTVVKTAGWATGRCTGSHASVILTCSAPDAWRKGLPVRQFLIGGLDEDEVAALRNTPERAAGPFRLASIGRLEGWKGFALGVMAFAKLVREVPDSEYWIVGDGPERGWLQKLARDLGCAGKMRFLGWLERGQVRDVLGQVDVVVHPSLHEQLGYAALEAMAAGRPVICLAAGGCGRLVADSGGRAVPVTTPRQVVAEIASALRVLAASPQERKAEGRRIAERAQQSADWEVVGAQIDAVYREATLRSSQHDEARVSHERAINLASQR